ncbi:MAG: PaaI family thioesterase [Candidatus Dormibacteraceae bacterium]
MVDSGGPWRQRWRVAELDPAALLSQMPLAGLLQLRLVMASAAEVRAEIDWRTDLCTGGGVIHGGTLMALADCAGAACAILNLPEGASTATIESKTNFFRAIRSGTVTAVTRPLHVGRRTIVVQTDIRDADGRHAAQVTQTQAVLIA